jgi:hypothetical protein
MRSPRQSDPPATSKAAERQYLDSIRPKIERAVREAKSKGTLVSSFEAAKKAAADKRKRQEEERRRAAAAARLERESRPEPPIQADNAPTPERLAKLMGVETITPPIKDDSTRTNTRAHRVQGVVEYYHREWTYEEREGAQYLVDKWRAYEKCFPTMTANLDGTPGNAFGPRAGGFRGKAEAAADASHAILQIEAIIFTNFGIKGLNLLRWHVWESAKVAKEGATMTEQMQAAGRTLAPFVKAEDRLWGITFGSLQRIFHFAYSKWVATEQAMQSRPSTPEQIAMRRQQRQRRMESGR